MLVAGGDTNCQAWKCLEKSLDDRGIWGNWVHLLNQDKGVKSSGAVVAVVAVTAVTAVSAVTAVDVPQVGVVANLGVVLHL